MYYGSFFAGWMNRTIYLEGVKSRHAVYLDITFVALLL